MTGHGIHDVVIARERKFAAERRVRILKRTCSRDTDSDRSQMADALVALNVAGHATANVAADVADWKRMQHAANQVQYRLTRLRDLQKLEAAERELDEAKREFERVTDA